MGNCDKCKLKADNVGCKFKIDNAKCELKRNNYYLVKAYLNIDTTKDKKGLETIEMKLSYMGGVEEVNLDVDHGEAILLLYDDRIIDLITIEEALAQLQTMKEF